MTWVARDHARFCRATIGVPTGTNADALCSRVGLAVLRVDIPSVMDAMTYGDLVAIRRTLPRQEGEHATLHELGHYLIHGAGGFHFWHNRDWVMLSKIERQAEEFAYFVALPSDELATLLWSETSVQEIAERYSRSIAWVMKRIELACAAGELAAWRIRAA